MTADAISVVPDTALDRPIHGANLRGRTLRDELAVGPVLMSFLRHFG